MTDPSRRRLFLIALALVSWIVLGIGGLKHPTVLTGLALGGGALSLLVGVFTPTTAWIRRQLAALAAMVPLLVGLVMLLAFGAGIHQLYAPEHGPFDPANLPISLTGAMGAFVLGLSLLGALGREVYPLGLLPDLAQETHRQAWTRPWLGSLGGLVLLGLLLALSWVRQGSTQVGTTLQRSLQAVADLRAKEVGDWYEERLQDTRMLERDGLIQVRLRQRLLQPIGSPVPPDFQIWLEDLQRQGYDWVVLLDAQGRVRAQVPEGRITGLGDLDAAFFRQVLQNQGVQTLGLHRDKGLTDIHLGFGVPVGATSDQGGAQGGLLLMVDPRTKLYPLLAAWPVPSDTAETVLIRPEGDGFRFLSDPRNKPGAALNVMVPEANAAQLRQALGEGAAIHPMDFRGVPVVAVVRPVPGTGAFLVAKMDQEEAFAPQRLYVYRGILAVLGLVGLGLMLLGLVLRRREQIQDHQRLVLAQRLDWFMREANDIVLVIDERGRILDANRMASQTYGYAGEEWKSLTVFDLQKESMTEAAFERFTRVKAEGAIRFEALHRRKDGSVFPVEVSSRFGLVGGDPLAISFIRDISERRAQEQALQRMTRLYAALSQVNQAIVRAVDRETMLSQVCEAMVEAGRFAMAWVAWDHPQAGLVTVAARYGDARGMLDRVVVRSDDTAEGRGAVGSAIREGRPVIIQDFLADPAAAPWREELVASGFVSIAALPIREAGTVRGALVVYASEQGVFGGPETALLEEAAIDISYALDHLAEGEHRRQAETALLESERFLRAAQEAGRIGTYEWQIPSDHWKGSPFLDHIFGIDASYPRTLQSMLDLVEPSFRDSLKVYVADLIKRHGQFDLEYPIIRKSDGISRWVRGTGEIQWDESGRPLAMSGVMRDVTERRAQTRQMERLAQVYAALSQVNQAIVMIPSTEALLRQVCEIMVAFGKFKMAWIGWDDPETHQVSVVAKHGDEHGYLDGIEIRSDDSPMGRGPTGQAIRQNAACVLNDLEALDSFKPWREAARKSGFASTSAFPIRQGGRVVGALMLYAGEPGFFGPQEIALLEEAAGDLSFSLDMKALEAQREKAVEALMESQARFQSLASTTAGAIFVFRGDHFVYANPAFCTLSGYTLEEIQTQPFWSLVHPEDQALVRERGLARQRGEAVSPRYDFRIVRKDGKVRWMDFTAGRITWDGEPAAVGTAYDITERKAMEESLRIVHRAMEQSPVSVVITDASGAIQYVNPAFTRVTGYQAEEVLGGNPRILKSGHHDQAFYREMWNTLITGQVWSGELLNQKKNGELFTEWATISPNLDEEGRITSYVAIKEDITEAKRVEEAHRQLEVQLQQAQKLESLGSLAGGVAHDMNNVLGAILGLATSLQEKARPDDPAAKSLQTIVNACLRGRGVVKSLLYFAHKGLVEEQLVDLNELVQDISQLLSHTTLQRIRIEMELAPDLGLVRCDPGALSHALMNLCVNAVDAMPTGGALHLETRALPAGAVEVRVRDTGEGMSPEVLAKALEPFFTTKPQGKGTGLGLAMTYATMQAHQGDLRLSSELGRGTEAVLSFPASRVEARPAPVEAAGGGEAHGVPVLVVLVVDDDLLLRESLAEVLEVLGHQSIQAAGGEEALRLLEDGLRVDVVILDMNMPEMTGAQALPKILALRPDLPVIMSTGHSDEDIADLMKRHPTVESLRKPFTMKELAAKLANLRNA